MNDFRLCKRCYTKMTEAETFLCDKCRKNGVMDINQFTDDRTTTALKKLNEAGYASELVQEAIEATIRRMSAKIARGEFKKGYSKTAGMTHMIFNDEFWKLTGAKGTVAFGMGVDQITHKIYKIFFDDLNVTDEEDEASYLVDKAEVSHE